LNAYKLKHKQTKTNRKNNKKVTNLLETLRDGIKSTKTNQLTSRPLDESRTTTSDNFTTNREQQLNDITKHDKTNDLDTIKLDDDLIKSLNPEGEVIVDRANANRQNVIAKHENENANTDTDEKLEQTNDIMKLDDDLIKSLNPEGQVVVDNPPRKPLLPKKQNAETDKNTNEIPQKTNSFSQSTNTNAQNTNKSPLNTNDDQQNDSLQKNKIDPNLMKGKVSVDDPRQATKFNEQLTKQFSGVDIHDTENDLMTNLQTNITELDGNTLDDDEAVIKSINPAGGVVVKSEGEGNSKSNAVQSLQILSKGICRRSTRTNRTR
jgi:hypothetical protein